jgi:hypothetical protein
MGQENSGYLHNMEYPREKITNRHNIPEEVFRAIVKDRYTNTEELPSDYSATGITSPIQITVLKQRHADNLRVFDVTDFFWSFMGSIAHSVLEEAWHESIGSKVEERLYVKVLGKVLSGKIDCYHSGEIRDYKTTKAYKIVKGDYLEWEKQLNIYAYICRINNRPVTKLSVTALIFDWKERETYKKEYPQCPIVQIPIRMWEDNEQELYVKSRIRDIEASKELTDEHLPQCSEREMWQDVKDYAIFKQDATRATKVFDTEEEAVDHLRGMRDASNKGFEYRVIKRMTERTRCLKYCPVANICQQNKRLLELEGEKSGDKLPARLVF